MIVLLVRNSHRKLLSLSLTLIAAGALGNMIDRTVYGYVVDFLDFYWQGWHWPAFNVADTAICIGAFLACLVIWRKPPEDARGGAPRRGTSGKGEKA